MAVHPVREAILHGALCAHLRTKGMYVAGDEGPPPELPHPADTAAHWCVLTGWACGPDLRLADRHGCSDASRSCFVREPSA
jgi:hypothetical protein